MKKHTMTTRLMVGLLALLTLSMAGLAAEAYYFDTPIPCERMTVDTVTLTREGDELTVDIVYTLHDDLTAEDKEALELMGFNVMPDAESTDFPDGFRVGEVMSLDDTVGADQMVAGVSYREVYRWDASVGNGDVMYLRPYYKLIGEWGDVITLDMAEAKAVPAE